MLFMRIELRGLGGFCTTQMSSTRDNDPIQVYIRYKLKCQDYEMAHASATCPCLRVYSINPAPLLRRPLPHPLLVHPLAAAPALPPR